MFKGLCIFYGKQITKQLVQVKEGRRNKKKRLVIAIALGIVATSTICLINSEFIGAFIENPKQVGAVLPCSPAVGKEMAKYIVPSNDLRVLEVGAGTGAITEQLVYKMQGLGVLDVIEIDSNLCSMLREKFSKYPNVKIHECSILDYGSEKSYDHIISTLPFNSFDEAFARAVISKFDSLAKKDGCHMSYVEYIVSGWKQHLPTDDANDVKAVKSFLDNYRLNHEGETVTEWVNVPPIYIYHLSL